MTHSAETRIGYVVNAFPVASETFLVNELRGVEAAGVSTAILTLDRRQHDVRPVGTDQVAARSVRPPEMSSTGWLKLAGAHLGSLARRPRVYLRMLRNDGLTPLLRSLRVGRRAGGWKALRRRLRLFLLAPWIVQQARRAGVGHLHAHYAKDPLEVVARASWLSGLTYSFSAHAKDLYTTPKHRLARRLAKAKYALTCHPHGDRYLRRLARPQDRSKIHLIRHGLDQELFRPSQRSRRRDLIVAAGRLTPKKGFDTLIEACSILRDRLEFRCVILGDGRQRRELAGRIRAAGLEDRVRLARFVDQRKLARWFRRARVVAVPARVLSSGNRDGVPNVLTEAMACGTPVVTTAVGSIAEVVRDGVSGLLVPPDDPHSLAQALFDVLTSERLAQSLAKGARQVPSRPSIRSSGKAVARLHRRQLRPHGSHRSTFRMPQVDSERLVRLASRRLGKRPRLRAEVEGAIAKAVSPGLAANAWRDDLPRLAERRLWDEVFKARRADELCRFADSLGVGLDRSTQFLDLGSGRGGLSVALRARGIPVTALDLRWRNCAMTRLRGRRYDLELPVVNGRAESLPFRDGSFEVVCLLEVLEHVGDPESLLSEARRVCRADGLCVVTVVNRWAHLDPHYKLWGINFMPRPIAEVILSRIGRSKRSWRDNQRLMDMHYFSFGSFRRFARTVGFEVHDPGYPQGSLARVKHGLGRKLSLGFNTVTLILEPV